MWSALSESTGNTTVVIWSKLGREFTLRCWKSSEGSDPEGTETCNLIWNAQAITCMSVRLQHRLFVHGDWRLQLEVYLQQLFKTVLGEMSDLSKGWTFDRLGQKTWSRLRCQTFKIRICWWHYADRKLHQGFSSTIQKCSWKGAKAAETCHCGTST